MKSRAHLEAMVPTLNAALADAGMTVDDVDAIAVTSGPGLMMRLSSLSRHLSRRHKRQLCLRNRLFLKTIVSGHPPGRSPWAHSC